MKPSKYFLSESPLRVKLYMGEFNKTKVIFDELDKRFIDREDELEITKRYLELNLKDDYKAMKDLIEYNFKKELKEKIKKLSNPYPKDVFVWDNKEKLNFNRGRFNRHCYEIIENLREEILKLLEE